MSITIKKIFSFVLVLSLMFAISAQALGEVQNEFEADETYVSFSVRGTFDYDEAAQVLEQINELRTDLGLSALIMDEALTKSAMQRAAETAIYFDHSRPDGRAFYTAIQGDYSAAGENIAMGYYDASSVMTGWTNSQGHYNNMVNTRYTAIGIGCFYQGDGTKYWAQLFTGASNISPIDKKGKTEDIVEISAFTDLLSLKAYPDNMELMVGETQDLYLYNSVPYIELLPSFCESQNEDVVDVDENGIIRAVGEGSTLVKIGLGEGLYRKVNINVRPASLDVENIDGLIFDEEQGSLLFAGEISAADIFNKFEVSGLNIYDKDNKQLTEQALVGSGSALIFEKDGEVLESYVFVMLGDMGGDGKITASDARLALRISASLVSAEDWQIQAGDVDLNGKVTAVDARLILRASARLESPEDWLF